MPMPMPIPKNPPGEGLTKMFRGRINENAQRKDQRRCSGEGSKNMFGGRSKRRCSEEGSTKMFRGRIHLHHH
eukprot:3657931-Karenia_brevis.AAC.1